MSVFAEMEGVRTRATRHKQKQIRGRWANIQTIPGWHFLGVYTDIHVVLVTIADLYGIMTLFVLAMYTQHV